MQIYCEELCILHPANHSREALITLILKNRMFQIYHYWPQVKLRQDVGKIKNFDFSTHCGHGFVSAIVTGIELNAAITTSRKTSAHTAKLSGSLKLEALEGLIKGSGSIEGKSETVKSLETSQLKSFILGGEHYSLPTTIEKLRDFVIGLPVLADQYPRPVRIAISPYSSLTTGKWI